MELEQQISKLLMVVFEESVAVLENEDYFPSFNHLNQVIKISDVDSQGLKETVHEALAIVVHG
jgi:hypothetical protein